MISTVLLVVALAAPAPRPISPDLVCLAKDALRGRAPAWSPETCEKIAEALAATGAPRTVFSISILESGLLENSSSPEVRLRKGRFTGKKARDIG
jgi:hypothetical protein